MKNLVYIKNEHNEPYEYIRPVIIIFYHNFFCSLSAEWFTLITKMKLDWFVLTGGRIRSDVSIKQPARFSSSCVNPRTSKSPAGSKHAQRIIADPYPATDDSTSWHGRSYSGHIGYYSASPSPRLFIVILMHSTSCWRSLLLSGEPLERRRVPIELLR